MKYNSLFMLKNMKYNRLRDFKKTKKELLNMTDKEVLVYIQQN